MDERFRMHPEEWNLPGAASDPQLVPPKSTEVGYQLPQCRLKYGPLTVDAEDRGRLRTGLRLRHCERADSVSY